MFRNRSVWTGLLGNLLEHYDAALFGLLAPFLAPLFFPSGNPVLSLISVYALLPIGLLTKPAGALLFGWIGDRFGRRKALSASLFGMGAATGAIGYLPTYDEIGLWAPVLLAMGRALQSFFAAGETTGGAIFLLEKVSESKRTFASSIFDASGILGILIGSALVSQFSASWRWLFWAGALTGVIGAVIRWDGKETVQSIRSKSVFKTLWEEKISLLSIACVAGFSYVNYYLITTFMNGFLPLVSSITRNEAMELNTLLLSFDMALLLFIGWIAKRVSKLKLIVFSVAAILVCSIPLFQLLEDASIGTAAFVRLTLTFLGVILAAPYHAWAFERAPAEHRFLISAVGTAIGSRMLGAPAPAVSLWLYDWTHWAPAATAPLWLLGICAIGFLGIRPRKKLEFIIQKSV